MSLFEQFASKAMDQIDLFLYSLSINELRILAEDFTFRAHDHQIEPEGNHKAWLLMGGRGSGKTRAGSEAVIQAAKYGHARHIALVGENISDVLNIMVFGESGIMNCCPDDFKPIVKRADNYLIFPNGVKASFFSSHDPDGLRGPQFHFAWCDEMAKWSHAEKTWDNLQMALRLGDNPRQIITTTPRPCALLHGLTQDPDIVTTHATTYSNTKYLSPKYLDTIIKKYKNTRYGRQEIEGILLDGFDGALWSRELLDQNRIDPALTPTMFDRIVVGVDPPVTSGEKADECGIIVAGAVGTMKEGQPCYKIYILADYTVKGLTPHGWAEQVVRAYNDYKADRIVAESNQGGDMVRSMIQNIAPNISYRAAWARRGKILRAEPIAALYEQEMIFHVGHFHALEDQMCVFTLDHIYLHNAKSPDRVDALVWAVTDILYNSNFSKPHFHIL